MKKLYILIIIFLLLNISIVHAAFLTGLKMYYKMDNVSQGSEIDMINGTKLTVSGNVFNASGIILGARNMSGKNTDYLRGNNSIFNFRTGNFTIAFWLNWTTTTVINAVYFFGSNFSTADNGQSPNSLGLMVCDTSINCVNGAAGCPVGKYLAYRTKTATNEFLCPSKALTQNNFYYVVYVRNGTEMVIYLNGTYDNRYIMSSLHDYVSGGENNFFLAPPRTDVATGNGWNVDEFAVWNRTLSNTEISTLYNNGAGLAYPFGEGAATISESSFLTPINQTFWEDVLPQFNITCTATSSTNINASIYMNSTFAGSANKSGTSFNILLNATYPHFGKMTWKINCSNPTSSVINTTQTIYLVNTTANCSGTGSSGGGTCTPPSGITISPSCSIYQSGSGQFWNVNP